MQFQHVFAWLSAQGLIKDQLFNHFCDQLNRQQWSESLRCSIVGAEINCLDPYSGVDLSMLLECGDQSTSVAHSFSVNSDEQLLRDSLQLHLASSVWFEYDHPYNTLPLVYFTLPPSLFSADSLITNYSQFVVLLSSWLRARSPLGAMVNFPSRGEFCAWIDQMPSSYEIQQFGFSFRSSLVQPRILATVANPWTCLSSISNQEICDLLSSYCCSDQILLASAYPYGLAQFCGVEVLNDRLAKGNLRSLRHPPRLRGTRLLRLIQHLASSHAQHWLLPLQSLTALERRQTGMMSDMQAQEVIVSGVNHLKLVLRSGEIDGLKIYGGAVSNLLRFES